jgi:conjugative relaxase-like TrwC/TraI family protein
MLLVTQATSGVATKTYFETSLTQGDYYLGQEVAGHWRGAGAELLGLGEGAAVQREHFTQLLMGFHPVTGAKLTQRLRKDRRPGMDLTFSVPKSVSLAWAITADERLLDALREAVHETMARDVEPLMARRVRTGKFAASKQQQATGKLVYADFLHKTSRPVDGRPDPQLHVHAFVMNWTAEEGKNYAGEFEEIKRQAPTLQAKFHARLAGKIQQLGYQAQSTQYEQSGTLKSGWEIRGVERATIEKFSRRTQQIETYAQEHDVTDADKKGKLGLLTREQKDHGLSVQQLRQEWQSRLTAAERDAFDNLLTTTTAAQGEEGCATPANALAREAEPLRTVEAAPTQAALRATTQAPRTETVLDDHDRAIASVQYALDHHLYRQSTAERQQIVGTALIHGVNIAPEAIEKALDFVGLIEGRVEVNGCSRRLVTTRSVLEAERRMIAYAREGRGTRRAIRSADYVFSRQWLNEHQKGAVEHVLQSRDAVMAVVGGAGTGKTSMMEEAVEAIAAGGKEVFTFAPTTGAREVLQEKGFRSAQTVEHLIRNTTLHDKLRDQVIWIDEAGLLDVRTMNGVFEIAGRQNARVVLSGDTRQHASPRRGEAMRLLETEAGLKLARSEKIQRQQGRYKKVVALISRGHEVVDRQGRSGLLAGFDLLDAMGRIQEIKADDRHARLAGAYLDASSNGKSTLVVAPTHAEKAGVTEEIRSLLKAKGRLGAEEREFLQYRSLNLSEAQKSEARTYAGRENLVVQFHQNTKGGFQQGDRYRVVAAQEGRVELVSIDGKDSKSLPLQASGQFEVYSEDRLRLAVGDKIRFSLGGVTHDRKSRLSNGRLDAIKQFDRQGNIVLENGWKVPKDYAHVDHGYVVTSHAAQGKDRDIVIAAMGSRSLPAINARQFYVTVSRGKEDVVLYVDDKAAVRSAIQNEGRQLSATALVKPAGAIGKEQAAGRDPVRELLRRANGYREQLVSWWRAKSSGHEQTATRTRPQSDRSHRNEWGRLSPSPEGGRA